MKQRYICCAYISTNSKIYDILQCMTSPPYILLFTSYSPVICKDFFLLVYMYKSSRYYLVFDINLGPTVGNKTIWMFESFGLCIEYIF